MPTLVTTLKGVRSVAPCELLVTLITRYSSGIADEFLGLLFFNGELDRTFGLFPVTELADRLMDFGDWELEVFLEWEWDAHTLEWASSS